MKSHNNHKGFRGPLCGESIERSITLQWRHNESDGISKHRHPDCLLSRLLSRRSKKTSKLRLTGLCEGNSPVTGEFPAQMASDAEDVSIWWRHHIFVVGGGSLCIVSVVQIGNICEKNTKMNYIWEAHHWNFALYLHILCPLLRCELLIKCWRVNKDVCSAWRWFIILNTSTRITSTLQHLNLNKPFWE